MNATTISPRVIRDIARLRSVRLGGQGYKYRDPRQATTWGAISGEAQRRRILLPQATAASVEGLSGVGKTQACLRCLNCFPRQTIWHESFPRIEKGLLQTVWLSAAMLEQALRKYQSRAIETAKVIEELIQLAKDMRKASERGEQLDRTMTRWRSTTH